MSLEYLTLDIKYTLSTDQFEFGGNVTEDGRHELVETFIRGQIGAGKDKSKPDDREVYHITFKWYPENNKIEVSSDTGNKSLRDGILIHFLNQKYK